MDYHSKIEEHVSKKLSSARKLWFIHALVTAPILWFSLSSWWLLLIPIYLWITYHAAIHIAAASLVKSIPEELLIEEAREDAMAAFTQIKEKLDSGEIEPGPELYDLVNRAGLSVGLVEQTSEQIVGRYQDADIYEWVSIYDPLTKQAEKFFFEEVAAKDGLGGFILPQIEGKLTACVNGVIYTRALQPE